MVFWVNLWGRLLLPIDTSVGSQGLASRAYLPRSQFSMCLGWQRDQTRNFHQYPGNFPTFCDFSIGQLGILMSQYRRILRTENNVKLLCSRHWDVAGELSLALILKGVCRKFVGREPSFSSCCGSSHCGPLYGRALTSPYLMTQLVAVEVGQRGCKFS